MKLLIFSLFPFVLFSQQLIEDELDSAMVNAKKGIYWALSNLDYNKNRSDKELIFDNKLFASVKLSKEVDGIKIESKGFFNSTEVSVKIYRSEDFLLKEGYLKKDLPEEVGIKKKK
jgi:hypothetical protein